jgi:Protein of unknown function (DUF2794)
MTEADPPGSHFSRSESAEIAQFPASRRSDPPAIAFDRHELRQIMNLYGRMVAYGEWRDYAIDFLRDKAVFSIFRRSSEMPLYRIVKDPALSQRQGAYSVLAPTGMILKRGHDLARVLQAIDKPVRVVV